MNLTDIGGRTTLKYACIQGWKDVVELLLNHSKSQQIDLNHRNNQGYTAFMSACQSGQMDVVELLLTHPKSKTINFNARNSNGETALMRACRHGTLDLIKLILDHSTCKNILLPTNDQSISFRQKIIDLLSQKSQ